MKKDFLKGKGFYLVLSLCVVVAALACFWAVRSITSHLNDATSQIEQGDTQTWDLPEAQVEQKLTDVPKTTSGSTSTKSQESSRQSSSGSASSVPQETAGESAEPAAPAEASFVMPVSGEISQKYSGDELVYNKTLNDWRTHNGVDIACAAGAEVKAAVAGKVVNIYDDGMWGQIVEIESGEFVWRYTGLNAASVTAKVGDTLKAGQTFGTVGEITAEIGEGPHLHLEVLKGGNNLDPEHYFE